MRAHRTSKVIVGAACLGLGAYASADPITFTGTIRDFSADGQDFQGVISGPRTGLVGSTLGPGGVPTLNTGPGGWTPGAGGITSHESFARWYSPDHAPGATMQHPITLAEQVGRPGVFSYHNSEFFPADDQLGGNQGLDHNYHFTYEIRSAFVYQPGQFLRAGGDDDVWVFINGELALDVGGVHGFIAGEIDLDTLGLTPGEAYSFDLFYAERHRVRAELWVETNISTFGAAAIPLPAAASLGMAGLSLIATRRRRTLPA